NREDRETLQAIWKDLCYLCASDFRTFATDEKHIWFRNRMGQTIYRLENLLGQKMDALGIDGKKVIINPHREQSIGNVFDIKVSLPEGEHRENVGLKIDDRLVPTQDDYIEYYRDGSVRSAIVSARPRLSPSSINRVETTTSQEIKEKGNISILRDKNIVRTPNVMIQLSQKRGATIEGLTYPKISDRKMIFRLPHGYFGSIRLSDGSYSGDMILHDRSGLVINDLQNVVIRYPESSEYLSMYIPVRAKIMTPLGDFWKTYRVYIDEPRVDLIYQFQLKPVSPFYFRIGNVVINPEAFDKSSLYYATVNGGEDMETYPLNGREVIHDRPVDLTVSTHHSLGATEGWITIGDQDKSVSVITDKGQLYSVPLLRYEEFQSIYFLRVSHSIGETDETAHNFWQGHNKVAFTIVAHHNQHEEIRQKSLFMNQGIITM
ncbi:MAG: hypothetical protein JRJ85_16160, partial [Deltaproteobacteria bacterium]|nr:hypothetical protein [Deltaproteobacteria bacterium]